MVMMNMKNHQSWAYLLLVLSLSPTVSQVLNIHAAAAPQPHRILLDTDVDTDDMFSLLYLLKLERRQFDLKAVTINADGWSDAGHAVNHIYDLLFMMGRDDVQVGVGGEGGISEDGTILPNVGGYLPLIEQGMMTTGYCRYRQSVPVGRGGGRLDIDTNFGIRKAYLPQGSRHYSPIQQATAQQVMIDVISEGPTTVFLIGAHTNFAIFLMSNPELKNNVEHIYVMGGGIGSQNTTSCCPRNATSSCQAQTCVDPGNLFTDYTSNPYAEYNMFGDPFAAYQVFHSGIQVTLIPLDATNTIPLTRPFYKMLEQNQKTYEAQYIFKSLKMVHDAWFDNQFFKSYYMWDTFMAGVATSIMSRANNSNGENDFAEMKFLNLTVVTSNKPYGVSDGSNPFFDGRGQVQKFHLKKGGVHSGHVQERLRDPFCIVDDGKGKGKCKDGYTMEIQGPEAVQVLVATKAKPNKDRRSPLDREYFVSFLEVINRPQQSGKFNFTTQFPRYKEVYYKPDLTARKLGRSVIFDMDMSAGDFVALFYLLKVPIEVLDLKAILVTPTGWASGATIDVVYDLLHMMGRDDIPVGLGDVFAMNQTDPVSSAVGDCRYVQAIPHGSGGLIDSDTLYGLAPHLPRSPRRYTTENSVAYGAPRDTDHPELRQPSAMEVWDNITKTAAKSPGAKFTILTNGPLTTLANIILSSSAKNSASLIQDVYIVGGHINYGRKDKGNIFTIPSNDYAEFNMFLDPLAAKTVFNSNLDITLIPLSIQRKVTSFPQILEKLYQSNRTPEVEFTHHLLSRLHHLQKQHPRYQHMDIFLGETLGAVVLAAGYSHLDPTMKVRPIRVFAPGVESVDGQMAVDDKQGKPTKVVEEIDHRAYFHEFAGRLGDEKQSAVLANFYEQQKMWSL